MELQFSFRKLLATEAQNTNHNTDNHRLVLELIDKDNGLNGYIVFHRGGFVNPTFGATRIWTYKSQTDALKDALKLSETMSYKSAMAGLKYGGAKAVLVDSTYTHKKPDFLRAYSQYINILNGHFITGADVGMSQDDLKLLRSYSRYIVGLKSDPVKFTVMGVLYGIETSLKLVFENTDLNNRSFAIQGLGKTGMGLLTEISKFTNHIFVSDLNPQILKLVGKKFPKVKILSVNEITRHKVDVFSPCALSGAINIKNISGLKCRIIAGSANNQLESDTIGDLLHKLGIVYAPDYIINAGGLMAVVDEYENGKSSEERMKKQLSIIKKNLIQVFELSKKNNQPTYQIANKLAEERFNKFL